ncbi:MAG: zinc metallopeptidase [Lentisphaeria bacterium]
MFFWGLDPLYLILAIPGLIIAGIASAMVKSTFNKYSKIQSRGGMTGAQAAYAMLQRSGITDVKIERINGFLSDHYDPAAKTLRLSSNVYDSKSLSAIGVACHEAGHALQHADSYIWLGMRTFLVPTASIGSNFSYILFIIGLFAHSIIMLKLAILMFSAAVLFTIITLPVEWNASARAKIAMVNCDIVSPSEANDAGKVLNAAFMTYVAAVISAIMTLLYFLIRSGLLGGGGKDN